MIEFYQSPTSTCSGKVRLVLEEKGVAYTEIPVDLMKGEQRAPEYRKLNPGAVVPTIIHDGNVIIESTLINEYLDDVFPDPPLRPRNAVALAQMRRWPKLIDEETHPATLIVTYTVLIRPVKAAKMPASELQAEFDAMTNRPKARRLQALQFDGVEAEPFQDAIRTISRNLARIDAGLAQTGGPWLMGAGYTLADAAVTPWMLRYDMIKFSEMWADLPHLSAWWERIRERPNYRGAVSRDVTQAAIEARNKAGADVWPRVREILAAG